MEKRALALERGISGRNAGMAGLVRISSTETVAEYVLAPCLATMHLQHPDIIIELTPRPRDPNPSARPADISAQLRQPMQEDQSARRIGGMAFALYASADYIDARGTLDIDDGCLGHSLIVQTNEIQDVRRAEWLSLLAPRARVTLETNSHEAATAAAVHGGGLACLARFRADREAGLVRLAVPSRAPSAGIWLTAHRDSRPVSLVQAVLDHITDSVRGLAAQLMPQEAPPPAAPPPAATPSAAPVEA